VQVVGREHGYGVRGESGGHRWPYMMPPDNAVVLSVDEKPLIQALGVPKGI
jgi:hypothetical protein